MKTLDEIWERLDAVLGDIPSKRGELMDQKETAQKERERALNRLETADNIGDYEKAAEDLQRAETSLKLIRKARRKLDEKPRMSETEYMDLLNDCRALINNAVMEYQQKIKFYMDQIKAQKYHYMGVMDDINMVLISLDDAANILQTKHPHKAYDDDEKSNTKKAWESYAVRVEPSDAAVLAMKCEDSGEYDSIMTAAWTAVSNAYPRHTF